MLQEKEDNVMVTEGHLLPYPGTKAVPRDQFPEGAVLAINGKYMTIIKVEDDEQYGYRVHLKETELPRHPKFLAAFFTQGDLKQ